MEQWVKIGRLKDIELYYAFIRSKNKGWKKLKDPVSAVADKHKDLLDV